MPKASKRYPILRGQIERYGYDQEHLGKKIGRCEAYVNLRLCGRMPWTEDDMYRLMAVLQIPHDQMHTYFPPRGIEAKRTPTGCNQ